MSARSAHRTACASASAGGFSLFLPAHHTDNNQYHSRKQYTAYDDGSNIFCNPGKHYAHLPLCFDHYSVAPAAFAALADFLSGLKIIQSMRASTAIAAIKPITFRFPLNTEPNW